MRTLVIFLLGLLPMLASAQTLTETQKQEALQCATKFCNLLTRFSNGERTLNSQINALCSGADCSAFDDIKTNKEITLRNYLFAIQTKYPDKLPMTITAPSLANSKTYINPVVELSTQWGKLGGEYGSLPTTSVKKIRNIYIVFDVVQQYPTLGKLVDKKIVYDVKDKKITAFISNNGVYINYLNGLLAMTENDYKTALTYFEIAVQNNRSSLKKKCYLLATVCASYMMDLEKAAYYAEQIDDQFRVNGFKALQYVMAGQYDSAYPYVVKLESLMSKPNDLSDEEKGGAYGLLGAYYVYCNDLDKGLLYLKEADMLGSYNAGYCIFVFHMVLGVDFADKQTALDYVEKSAQKGYPPAFYQYGSVLEFGLKDKKEALYWYEKAAQSGISIGMACAGKLLIEKGEKTRGVQWLRKALKGNQLEMDLKTCEKKIGGLWPWPKSRAEVQTLLNKYEHSAGGYTTPSYSGSTHSTPSHSSSSSSGSYSSTYTSTNSHGASNGSYSSSGSSYSSSSHSPHKFNAAKDKFCAGLSAGYVRKQWVYDYGDEKVKMDVFGEKEYTNGIQVGFRIDEQYGYGLGVDTGLYYEYYFGRSNDFVEDGYEGYFKVAEHSLYLPAHLKYNLNFSKWFQIGLYGGIGLDYGVSGKIYLCSDGEVYDSMNMYDDDLDIKRFNASLEYGGSIRIRRFQVNCTFSHGLVNMAGSDEYKVKLNKIMSISASICF